ncbi:MAG TPA: hypothetical protein PLU72_02650 [Candidatus Ozemobacteraceae bacterium]|nr:hypothetical protein [Candidatus Ozemobacteraceae bacterium]
MRLFRLMLGLVLVVLFAALGAWGALSSAAGNEYVVRWGAMMAAQNLDADMQLGRVTGTVLEALRIDGVQGMVRRSRTGFVAGPVEISFNLRQAPRRGLVIGTLDCPWLKLWGGVPVPPWFGALPELPPPTCQADLKLPVGIDRVRLGRIDWMPAASGPVEVTIASFAIDPASRTNGLQPVSFSLSVRFKGAEFAAAAFDGHLASTRAALSGKIEGNIFGFPVDSGLKVSVKRDGVFAEGTLAEMRVDLTVLSKWLSPLWRDTVPLFVNGRVTAGGTWMVQPKIGFAGRFQGRFDRVVFVLTGFNLPLAELNAPWKFFDDKLHIENENSRFIGFPASFSGAVALAAGLKPDWGIEARVADLPLAELIATLPWAVRYGYGVPYLAGLASMTARFDGTAPGILVNATALVARQTGSAATSSVSIRYRHAAGQPDRWDLESRWTAESVMPKGFAGLPVRTAPSGEPLRTPFEFRFEGHGTHVDKLDARLGILWNESSAWEATGLLEGHTWEGVVAGPEGTPVALPQGLGLVDFLLPGM